MRKRLSVLLALILALGLLPVFAQEPAPEPVLPYHLVVSVEDWGAAIPIAVLHLKAEVEKDQVSKDALKVTVQRKDARGEEPLDETGEREVLNAFVSDAQGEPVDKGSFVTVEMAIGPTLSVGNALNYAVGSNTWVDLTYTFAFAPGALADLYEGKTPATRLTGIHYGGIDQYTFGMKSYGPYTLHYASYKPPSDGMTKRPLLVWLHGGGEGGSDPTIPLSANKATVFATPAFQDHFEGGIHVLVPQAPTMWMDGGDGAFGDGTSIYEDALMQLIRDYVAANDVNEQQILVGGLSNGGYMTMLLARDYPDYFKGYVPVCEALADNLIADEQIASFAKLPMWFVAAHTDDTVAPGDYMLPTVERIKKLEPANLHATMYDKLLDKTGLYKTESGEAFEYPGHWSWIEVYNNDPVTEIEGKQVSLFEWLGSLVK